ncbi:hypothetical protein L198_00784 [Cryptococcus wingfieldii CBS 7118]|uniref:Uncharacterized protein n=1 Tax=Cryptococcus wingfieldii CBS 7118 TaxID=1295528 RepID=A0A1E3K2D0_9TREE|nr:hypothetical protein L198_00784 [Cryptococcus wingfieldii CBS 7118]ODO07205.1 hypothetical protein L198_00784 [Cryptococcus wingfieldii CBS 7118]
MVATITPSATSALLEDPSLVTESLSQLTPLEKFVLRLLTGEGDIAQAIRRYRASDEGAKAGKNDVSRFSFAMVREGQIAIEDGRNSWILVLWVKCWGLPSYISQESDLSLGEVNLSQRRLFDISRASFLLSLGSEAVTNDHFHKFITFLSYDLNGILYRHSLLIQRLWLESFETEILPASHTPVDGFTSALPELSEHIIKHHVPPIVPYKPITSTPSLPQLNEILPPTKPRLTKLVIDKTFASTSPVPSTPTMNVARTPVTEAPTISLSSPALTSHYVTPMATPHYVPRGVLASNPWRSIFSWLKCMLRGFAFLCQSPEPTRILAETIPELEREMSQISYWLEGGAGPQVMVMALYYGTRVEKAPAGVSNLKVPQLSQHTTHANRSIQSVLELDMSPSDLVSPTTDTALAAMTSVFDILVTSSIGSDSAQLAGDMFAYQETQSDSPLGRLKHASSGKKEPQDAFGTPPPTQSTSSNYQSSIHIPEPFHQAPTTPTPIRNRPSPRHVASNKQLHSHSKAASPRKKTSQMFKETMDLVRGKVPQMKKKSSKSW